MRQNSNRRLPRHLRPPPGTAFSNAIRLLWPSTYSGLIRFLEEGNGIEVTKLLLTWACIFLAVPGVILCAALVTKGNVRSSIDGRPFVSRLAYLTGVSPLAAGCLRETLPIASQISQRLHLILSQRKSFDDEIVHVLALGTASGRIQRRRRYDLYLPPSTERCRTETLKRGLILLPGFLTDHTSYAAVAAQLSEKGIIVVVLSMEPLRIAWPGLGGGNADVLRAMRVVSRTLHPQFPHIEWSVGGHSLGGYAALSLAPQLSKKISSLKIVVWAAGNVDRLMPDLSRLSPSRVQVFSIWGTCDAMCKFTRRDLRNFRTKLPSNSIERVIKGGNHNGFASYPCSPGFDGIREIMLDSQHNFISKETAKWLMT